MDQVPGLMHQLSTALVSLHVLVMQLSNYLACSTRRPLNVLLVLTATLAILLCSIISLSLTRSDDGAT